LFCTIRAEEPEPALVMDREVRWDLRREYAEEADGPTAAARRMANALADIMVCLNTA